MKFEDDLILGLDGGGTKCKAILVKGNEIIGSGLSGPGNPVYGVEQAKHSIVEAASEALRYAGISESALKQIPISMGLAGVNVPELYQQMVSWEHPFKTLALTTDLVTACLGAHDGGYGAVVIVGTGSCGFCYTAEQQLTVGAHGFPQGDMGSGAWFGLRAVQAVLLANDRFVEKTTLTPLILRMVGADSIDALVGEVAGKDASYFARFASAVFECAKQQDPVATGIVNEGVAYIAELIAKLNVLNPPRISIIGGLSAVITAWLPKEISRLISNPVSSPEMGAVHYFKNQFNSDIKV